MVCAALMLAAVSCGLSELEDTSRGNQGGIWTGPGMDIGKDDPESPVCYVTAFDYRDGYDWVSDVEKGTVKCSLTVFADGVPMMKIPVGDEYEISSDPDMHRMIDRHVYSDFSTARETVVRKDGKELFRFDGREAIVGLLVDSTDVYTLGHPRAGDGFVYRRNGEILLSREKGRSFGRLQRDGEDICFAFSEPVKSQTEVLERCYHVRNGVVTQEALREDVKKVWDVASFRGKVCYVADVVGVRSPVLFMDDGMEALALPENLEMKTCRLTISSESFCIEGICVAKGRPISSILWPDPSEGHVFSNGMTVTTLYAEDGGVCCVLNPVLPGGQGMIFRNGEPYCVYPGYVAVGCHSAAMVGGILHVGLSSKKGEKPVIWKDGIVDTLDVNGFISSVTVGKGR